MTFPRRSSFLSRSSLIPYVLCGLVVAAALLMVVPIYVPLAAGIASISLVLFAVASCLLAVLLVLPTAASRTIIATSLVVALSACFVPQLAFVQTAQRMGASLTFDPLAYLTFSGDTTMSPTRQISYKSSAGHALRLAVYNPQQPDESRPAVALLHGGGWRYGSYLQTGNWPRLLTDAGFVVVSIDYRLSSDTRHTWREAPADVHDAINYLQDHAKALSIDPAAITLFGQSAGGHLALLEAYRHQAVQSVVSLYAPIDLALDYKTSRDKSAELDFIGGPPGQYPDRYRVLSPSTYVSSNTPRTLLIQGKSDDLVAWRNATALAAQLADHRVDHQLLLLPLTGHSFENQRGGFATQIATQQVLTFLSR